MFAHQLKSYPNWNTDPGFDGGIWWTESYWLVEPKHISAFMRFKLLGVPEFIRPDLRLLPLNCLPARREREKIRVYRYLGRKEYT